MALVKCTQTLFEHANGKIQEMFKDRLASAHKIREFTTEEIVERIYTLTHTAARIAAAKDLESIMNMRIISDCELTQVNLVVKTPTKEINRIFSMTNKSRPTLHEYGNKYSTAPKFKDVPEDIKQAVIAAHLRYTAVNQEMKEFKEKFQAAWSSVRSVNELIKLWPAASELFQGTDVLERISRKTGPRTKTEEEQAFNPSDLNVALLKAKVAK